MLTSTKVLYAGTSVPYICESAPAKRARSSQRCTRAVIEFVPELRRLACASPFLVLPGRGTLPP
ncbi:Uncharacterised protein [Mycobacteroides abscessus subsp. abscessus]|nr:Uncharacterised protein [Mycobacteroides abscessus subsp. abscessus]